MRNSIFTFEFLLSVILKFRYLNAATTVVDCPLVWIPSGYGDISHNSVECSPGTNEYVGRVILDGTWVAGRVVPRVGKIYATNGVNTLESELYQLLTTPTFCIIDWTSCPHCVTVPHSVPIDEADDQTWIARGIADSQYMCGTYDIAASGVHLQPSDSDRVLQHVFETLISYYPPLHVTLSNFNFDLSNVIPSNSKTEIVGQEEIKLHFHPIKPIVDYKISHQKMLREKFIFYEDNFNWVGIERLDLSFPFFYGTDDFILESHKVDEEDGDVVIVTMKSLKIESQFHGEGGNVTANGIRHVQICTTVKLIEDIDISFTATATYRTSKVKAVQIRDILSKLNRPFDAKISRGNEVVGKFKGVLTGRMALHTSLYIGDPDPDFICSSFRG